MKIWILTSEYNEYDQHGEYFEAVFSEKPNPSQLTEYEVPQNHLRHVLNGGGRVDEEQMWFWLREVDVKPPTVKPPTE